LVTFCTACKKPPVVKNKRKVCGNLACVDYNKIVKRRYEKKEEEE
tara:strand:- start:248 stop:382 length:135 start_codon:yes stop_codon:yes gene_type:complete